MRLIMHERHHHFVARVMHDDVLAEVDEDGLITARYLFMVVMSAGIAMLGLLLSSPAVVIGAMLISPLMSPIMSLGFSLCVLDIEQLKNSLKSILIGFLLAVSICYIIVMLSPLNDPTDEIISRTRPNLFDLMVAVFSGFAGGYAVIKRKGATIVGVAIATALMPPLAVIGYGLAVGNYAISEGAFFLFMTNLLAISLCVTALAKWYGFGGYGHSKHTWWQALMILSVFAMLSLPLGLSLKKIANESYVARVAKAEIVKIFAGIDSNISMFTLAFEKDKLPKVNAVILTRKYKQNAESEIDSSIEKKLGNKIDFYMDQIVVANGDEMANNLNKKLPSNIISSSAQSEMSAISIKDEGEISEDEMVRAVKDAILLEGSFVDIKRAKKLLTIHTLKNDDIGFGALKKIEEILAKKFPKWKVEIIPPAGALPYIYFSTGKSELDNEELKQINDILWVLTRWQAKQVEIVGFASTIGEFDSFNNNSLAYLRAKYIENVFADKNITSNIKSEYISHKQRQNEKQYGTNSFQRVEIRLMEKNNIISNDNPAIDKLTIEKE